MKAANAKNTWWVALALAVLVLPILTQAQVTNVMLQDGNSTAVVAVNSDAGMHKWTVDGMNQLNQQWFWYRVGSGPEAPINSISNPNWYQSAANTLDTTYANGSYSVEISYTLVGGGAGSSDISEGITIHNSSASPLTMSFYQYSDFNLLNDPSGDQVVMDAGEAYQWKGATSIAEGIIAPNADEFEANLTGGAGSTLYKLNNVNNLALNDSAGAGPGDVTWAFEWDLTIAAGGTDIITKDKELDIYVVPEPSALALAFIGLVAVVFRRRTRA